MEDVLAWPHRPGRVFDFETDLEASRRPTAAMDERRVIKSLVRVRTLDGQSASARRRSRRALPDHVST